MLKRVFVAIFLLMIFLCAAAYAAPSLKNITASIDQSISIFFNNDKLEPKEKNGTRIWPISYNNRIYLPVRAIAEMAGIQVQWDEQKSSVTMIDPLKLNRDDPEYMLTLQPGNVLNEVYYSQFARVCLNEGAGNSWSYTISDPSIIKIRSKGKVVKIEPASAPVPGEPDEYVWTFQPVKTGSCKIIFKYYRSWNGEKATIKSYEYNVKVLDK